jgi:hypothetical protein
MSHKGAQEGQPVAVEKERPLLIMRVTDINRHSHIDNIVWYLRYNVRAVSLTPRLDISDTSEGWHRKRGL